MFKKNSPGKQLNHSTVDITFIAADCQITGNLKVKGDIRIDGNVEGNILATGAVIVGQSANIKANIEGKIVILAGEAHGDVKSYDLLELASGARLYGNICSRQLKIDQGAIFVGNSKLNEDKINTKETIPEISPANSLSASEKNQEKLTKRNR